MPQVNWGVMRSAFKSIASAAVTWLFNDTFTSSDGSGTRTRTAQPGPGSLGIVDSAALSTISGDTLIETAICTGGFDPVFQTDSQTRAAGLCGFISQKSNAVGGSSASPAMGVKNSAGSTFHFISESSALAVQDQDCTLASTILLSSSAFKQIAFSLRTAGMFIFLDAALIWVEVDLTLTPLLFFAGSGGAGRHGVGTLDYIKVRQLPAPFDSDYGIATYTDTTLTSGDTFTGTADGIRDFNFTLPGSPAAGDEIALETRRQDTNNKWKTYIKRNAGNTAWDFLADSVSAGTPTNRVTVTGVGTPNMVRETADGSLHNFYTHSGSVFTKRGGEINVSFLNTEVGQGITAVAGTTLTRVTSYARTNAAWTTELAKT